MHVVITGANGFIGRNLRQHLSEREGVDVSLVTRETSEDELQEALSKATFVFHLAGVNRPQNVSEFKEGNTDLTTKVSHILAARARETGDKVPLLITSSTQAVAENDYGISKRNGEIAAQKAANDAGFPLYIFRLPNVFGKWSRPNYNSAVATFCHNVARNEPIQITRADADITLVYIDDVVKRFLQLLDGAQPDPDADGFEKVQPQYSITVGKLAETIRAFKASRSSLVTERVGAGLVRALHSTYVSFLPPEEFSYTIPMHGDVRGVFVEMLKTPDCGQFSYFTAHPGITRGGHYHHSKTEKFLVIKGKACFKFRQIQTGEKYELVTEGEKAEIVETVPGWTHDITNIGDTEMVVMLWANEIFDRENPDTFACPL
ncbi:UDP-2-acetamido-2,6-beta-L-arabino-hexul-4-ose reductase [Marinobacter xiaoshiensis]|uniref:NAD-dependent epimerase/dehydratase family protein n=1 Tax=Marinobacter xiaoshiensis TaxID=3073652 RepID=A0ABU2HEK5_9GAMM|nr:NAD-dependent epimerase/dehydratase family protein [Marinobacter sp. F60267]MDS1309486.1 NAD-dependent epimerase/dehydratase family protein [Marinobacter sp. F60267]